MSDFIYTLIYAGERFEITEVGAKALLEIDANPMTGAVRPQWVDVATASGILKVRVWAEAPIVIIEDRAYDVMDSIG